MFQSRDESRFNLFSSYMALIVTFAVSSLSFLLFVYQNEDLYRVLSLQMIQRVDMLMNLGAITIVFLLFNTSYYALSSYRRRRMLVMSTAFLGVGIIQLVGITSGYPAFPTGPENLAMELAYGTLPRLLLSTGVLIGAFLPVDDEVAFGSGPFVRLGPILGAGFLFWLDQWAAGRTLGAESGLNLHLTLMLLEYVVASLYLLAIVAYLRSYSRKENRFMMHAASGFLVLIFGQALKLTYGLPPELTDMAFGLAQSVGLLIFFVALFRNNIDIPLTETVNAEKQIKLYAENLEKIVERRTSEIRQVNARFIREMDYARSIQQSLLPLKRLSFKNAAFYSEYYPCERLSGDFYDIYRIDDDHVGMYVLDVSGHGISAALMTMFCNNYIKSTERLIKRYRGLKPHRNLKHFYEEFNKMNFPEEMHMVIFFASYNLVTKVLTYSSGGMNCHPILVRQNGTWEYLDRSQGFPICRLSDFFEPDYTSEFIHLQEGDRLIFYTDGLVDMDKNNILDQDQLVALMLEYRDRPAKALNRVLTDRIESAATELDDDVTYFIMEITA